jgi:O-antigen/teichoic acid export membrane protein
VLRSIFFNWTSLVVSAVVSIVLTPIMIRSLGQYYYGMWVLVMSLSDQYGLLDLGMTAALLRFAGYFQGARDHSGLDEIFSATFLLTVFISLAICVFSVVAAGFLPSFFGIAAADHGTFIRLVLILGLTTAIAFPERMLAAYLRGIQRFDLSNAAATGALVIRAIAFFAALSLGAGIISIAMITLVMSAVSFAAHYLLIRWADAGLRIRAAHVTLSRLRQLFGFSIYAFIASLGTRFISRIDSIVIGRILTVSLIAPFNVASRLTEYFAGVFGGVHGPVLSAMSELDGAAKQEELRHLFIQSSRYTFLLSLFIGSLLLVDGQAFLTIWLGSTGLDLHLTYQILIILGVCYIVNQAQLPSWTVIYARAKHQLLAWFVLAEGLANLLLSVYWGHRYGLIGIAFGTMVPAVIHHLLIIPYYALCILGLSLRSYIFGLWRPVLAGALFLGVFRLQTTLPHSLGTLALYGLLQFFAFGLITYVVALTQEERCRVRIRPRLAVSTIRSLSRRDASGPISLR